jgi:hypothetical protein
MRPAEHVFRRSALDRHAGPRPKAAAVEIPQPPIALSLGLLGALVVAGVAALLYLRVPEYSSGSLIVGPRRALFLAVPAALERCLRPGQAVVVPSASGAAARATIVGRRETMVRVRVGAFLHLELGRRLALGERVTIARLESAGRTLAPVGAVLPARVEVGRTSVLSRVPIVGRLI